MSRRVRNDGKWETIIGWLDELAGGRFVVPPGKMPPITMNEDGSCYVYQPGGRAKAEVGDYIFVGGDGVLYPIKPHEIRKLRATAKQSDNRKKNARKATKHSRKVNR